ncbi:cysteine hydrolase [soil metagenome]
MADTALLVIDMLNAFEHSDADLLIPSVAAIIEPLTALIARVNASASADVIYVNDNYGDFTAAHKDIVNSALRGRRPDLVEPIAPSPGHQMLTKARHSAFYSTPLAYLLNQNNIGRVILAGQVTEQSILYSALDAYVRQFDIAVATDAVAHIDAELADAAMRMIAANMGGQLLTAAKCEF